MLISKTVWRMYWSSGAKFQASSFHREIDTKICPPPRQTPHFDSRFPHVITQNFWDRFFAQRTADYWWFETVWTISEKLDVLPCCRGMWNWYSNFEQRFESWIARFWSADLRFEPHLTAIWEILAIFKILAICDLRFGALCFWSKTSFRRSIVDFGSWSAGRAWADEVIDPDH